MIVILSQPDLVDNKHKIVENTLGAILPLFGSGPGQKMQIWLFDQLVGGNVILLAWHQSQASVPRPFCTQSHQKADTPPFIHGQDCPGLLLIYEVVPIEQPPECCLCSPPVTGWSSRWEALSGSRVVRHAPLLILPSESLQRTVANICEPPECSIRKEEACEVGGCVWLSWGGG